MRYLIPKFDCCLLGENKNFLKANVQYRCENVENNFILIGKNNEIPFVFDFTKCDNVEIVKFKQSEFYFLFDKKVADLETVQIKYQNKSILISLSNCLSISFDGDFVLREQVCGIKYSHYKIIGDICLLYFAGVRNYIVILKGAEVCCASFYDEFNLVEEEYLFLCRLYDSLNHGKVFKIKDKKFETYLVYLDDYDLNLKQEFFATVFLDCIIAGNLKYANSLLANDLKQADENKILDYFEKFDWFYPISEKEVFLFKKNTLAGIYSFEFENNKISNIIQQD